MNPYDRWVEADNVCVPGQGKMPQVAERNPQTVAFLEMLGLPYDLDPAGAAAAAAGPIAGLLLTL